MVSRLLGDDESSDDEIRVVRRECSSQQQANGNMASEYEGVFELLRSPFSGLGEDYSLALITAQAA